MNWLVLYHVTTIEEKDLFYRILNSITKRRLLFDIHIVYLYSVPEDVEKGKAGYVEECLHFEIPSTEEPYPDDRPILVILEDLFPNYSGFVYSGHSSGYLFGKEEDPIFSIVDLSDVVDRTNHKFKVAIFDTCYINNLETLYQLRHMSDYILATPSFCEDASVLELPAFFKNLEPLVEYLKNIVDQYVLSGNNTCAGALRLSLVRTEGLHDLAMSIRDVSPALEYNSDTIVHPADHKLHHICDVILNAFDDGRLLKEDLDDVIDHLKKTVIYSKSSPNADSCHHTVCIGIYSELPYHPIGHEIEYFTF